MPNLKELEDALLEADRAGNKEDATILAAAIESMRAEGSAPVRGVRGAREREAGEERVLRQQRREEIGREVQTSLRGHPMAVPGAESPSGLAVDLALEAGIPALAQGAAAPFSPAAQSAAGAGSSALGNTLAQLRRMSVGEQEEFSKGQLAAATTLGAIPFAGPAKTGAGVLRRVGDVAKGAAQMGAAGYTGKAVETLVDRGELPTKEEALTSTAVPAFFGAGLPIATQLGRALTSAGGSIEEATKVISSVGKKPTPGMMMPDSLSAIEALKIARDRGGDVAQAVDQVYESLGEGLQNVAGAPHQRAEIAESLTPRLGRITAAEDQIAKLNDRAAKARDEATTALDAVREMRGKADEATLQKARELSDKAFTEARDSVLENARALALEKVAGAPLDEATARTLRAEFVAKPLREAMDAQANALYEDVDNSLASFNTAPILAKANKVAQEVTGNVPKRLEAALSLVKEELGGDKTSLQALRNVRSELLKKVQIGDVKGSGEERLIKTVISEITDQINGQAVSALGPEMGERLLAANHFYRQKSDLFEAPGMEVLFDPNSPSSGRILAAIETSGKNADEFKNVQRSIAMLAEFDPEVASVLKGNFNAVLRGSIMQKAIGGVDASSGRALINGETLAQNLEMMEARAPGTLKALGLGDARTVGQLKTLFAKYPDAPQMSRQQWEDLFAQPAFQKATSARPLVESIEETLAVASADSKLSKAAQLLAAGKKDQALARYSEALSELDNVGADLLKANAHFEALVKDPVARAFNNPNLGEGDFNTFAKALFDPKAGKVKIEDVGAIADALRGSANEADKALLARLQERYIADRIASFKEFSKGVDTTQRPTVRKLSEFFNPYNAQDADNEINVARAILDPEQMKRLEKFADVAELLNRYEKFSAAQLERLSREAGTRGTLGGLVDLAQELWQRGKYSLAARYLANPEMAASRTKFAGEVAETAGGPAGAQVVKQTSRVLDERRDGREPVTTP